MTKIQHKVQPGSDPGEWKRAPACFYCDVPLRETEPGAPLAHDTRTRDHLIVRGAHGRVPNGRIVAACHLCNTLRGRLDAHVFRALAQKHIAPHRNDLSVLATHLIPYARKNWTRIIKEMRVAALTTACN